MFVAMFFALGIVLGAGHAPVAVAAVHPAPSIQSASGGGIGAKAITTSSGGGIGALKALVTSSGGGIGALLGIHL